jgi:membrane protease YdiL (CAAX protease family)
VHWAKPLVAFLIAVIGLIFAGAYLATGSLLAVMIGHAVYDVWALWFLQEEMHRLRVFDSSANEPNPSVN